MTVRRAQVGDIPWLLTQLQAFDRFYGTAKSLFPDRAYAETQLQALITTQLFLVAESGGEPRGFIAGLLAPHPLNPQIQVLSELFWWTAVEFRGMRASSELLDAFLDFGYDHADWIIFTLESRSPISARHLEKRGFRLHESSYLLEVS